MYEEFYGFATLPFSLLPDADFLFLSQRHRRAVNLLEYGILSQAGFIVITGEVGAGKTTIIRRFLKHADHDLTVAVINNPTRQFDRLMSWVALAFEYEDAPNDPVRSYDHFIRFLLAQYAKGKRCVLVIDEAQNMTPEMLEELRMLSNVNNEKDQLLQIVLVGQPELLDVLKRRELRQFTQRVAVHYHLEPLNEAETAAYIRHRVSMAGSNADLFDDVTCAAIYYFTGGVPRLINLLCDQVLVYGFSEDKPAIGGHMVVEVVMDRERSGLSAFRPLPDGWDTGALESDITRILHAIQKDAE